MRPQDLENFRGWFSGFTKSFFSADPEDRRNLSLKVDHTHHVCANCVYIAESVPLSPGEVRTAEAAGLFHDIGRFPQYSAYRTFRDSISVNHGKLGAETLERQNVLGSLQEEERQIILFCVKYHNAFSLPEAPGERSRLFLKLVRDADKIDIWRVFAEYFSQTEGERASAAGLGLPDRPEYSEKIISCILGSRAASLHDAQTLNDFKLLQLSWVFDLNFRASLVLLREKGDFTRIAGSLPETAGISRAAGHLHAYIDERLRADRAVY